MDEEITGIKKNDTWELASIPKGHKAIGVKQVYKVKKNVKREIEKHKARLVPKGYSSKVLKFKKAFYGLKQAPRAQNSRIDKYFEENGYWKSPYEHALYIKIKNQDVMIICLYVDDLIYTGNNPCMFKEFKNTVIREFEMTDIGLMAYYLGIKVKQKKEGIFISQESCAKRY